ncbi:MAG: 2-amino-4-hydroxy-6-hydroxymethyldihydropteridine diphosphokinase, partial [Sphingobacteriia bacterium]
MFKAYILSGSNLDQPLDQLQEAKERIAARCGKILAASEIYASPPWGYTEQPDFLNQALVVETILAPEALMQSLLQIEQDMGRIRARHMGPRRIDLDLLLVDQLTCDTPLLLLPHPR